MIVKIVPRSPLIDPDADVSWEETYDLPGEWFGLCAAIHLKAHTTRGLGFIERIRKGGTWGKATLYPTGAGDPQSAHLLETVASHENIRVDSWMQEGVPSPYFEKMEEFLGKTITDEARGKYIGELSEN